MHSPCRLDLGWLPTIGVGPADALDPFGFDWDEPRHEQARNYHALEKDLATEQGFAHDERMGWPPDHRLLGWPRHVQDDVLHEIVLMHFEANDVRDRVGDPLSRE